jgi:hypothetical protein
LATKEAGNKSVDGHMTACDNESGWQKSTQKETHDGEAKAGGGDGGNGDSDGSGGGSGG